MPNDIPTASRVLVRARDESRCVRCRVLAAGLQWHHRRPRNVGDDHQHCACVGILLCTTCHSWVHAHPMESRALGWIVSRHECQPFRVPFKRGHQDWALPDCEGKQDICWAETLGEAIEHFEIEETEAEITHLPK